MKLSEGKGQTLPGTLKNRNPDLRSEDCRMVYINGKILLRSSETKPFVYIDPETLKEEEVEMDFEGIEGPTLEWKTNEETGRSLTHSPLMFDGTYLYVVSRNKAVKSKEEIKNEDEE